ncbi:MAG: tRNA 2-selenouridine(34) synthase MnmH [Anaeromicrobium sp.]|jgi:tRNA 2-selenouridine synthase|uniref:tRNA 2-selenouridine(34) synthase MnmH n=1 Tax=Anaeromicrobium sp. TaxID=1929132 RepID=UPI0025D1A0B5|nr:tRNA 2-selenouridine(34) synthase MnmH [Anaeromicrobium sp.]MCT4594673.1 tRNA 2-selenouridine(34) synthase MnmH [Anaeromicrobium sp.]
MVKTIDIKDVLKMKDILLIDVRSQVEYEDGTILNAINIPILDNEERAMVGTIYKKECTEKATLMGIEYGSKKLVSIYESIKGYSKEYKNIVFFCYRGGMRSKSVCSFVQMMGIKNVFQLTGGYKSYRNTVVNFLEKNIYDYNFIMIHGLTGVGKTHILEKLHERGKSVLDLEKLANNSGSVFGNIMYNEKLPTQKNFDAGIFHTLRGLKDKNVYVESESKRIGNVIILNHIFEKIISDKHILVETNMENRITNIKKDYINGIEDNEQKLKDAIEHLRKRLGNVNVNMLIEKIDKKEYDHVIEYLIKNYYDPLYKYSIDKFREYDYEANYLSMDKVVDEIIKFVEDITGEGRN